MRNLRRIGALALLALLALPLAPPLSAQATTDSASAATPKRAPRRSWTSDRREFGVGDVITVLVDEQTLASQDKDNTASETKQRQAALGFNVQSATSSSGTQVGFNTNNNGSSEEKGASTRQNRFQTEVSVRVVSVSPSGLLQVKGKKILTVDKNVQEITIAGWVRPQDISSTNLVDGFRVADAELAFSEKGGNLSAPKGGIISRLIGKLWP
jgi:flagellar L-ring protein precursor FlgH